jgi:hypothetical protein
MLMINRSLMEDDEMVTLLREKGASIVADIAPTVPFAPGNARTMYSISGQSAGSVASRDAVRAEKFPRRE